jgi:DegV family protein with EDD domain
MAGVRIVTDSACDLTKDQYEPLGIGVVPLTIRIGADEFTDMVDLSSEDFYRRMAASDTLPETAAPSPGAFEAEFRRLADDGADGIVCINLSGDLSATIESARNAARALDGACEVRVLDSLTLTAGQGTIVLAAAESAAAGAGLDDIEQQVDQLVARTRVFATLDTLDNLKKGGRIGAAAHLLGSMLSFKPMLDISGGKVEEAGRVRTRKKALLWLRDKLFEEPVVERLAIYDAAAPDIEEFLALVEPRYPRDQFRTGTIGPVIGTHGGQGTIGICYLAAG